MENFNGFRRGEYVEHNMGIVDDYRDRMTLDDTIREMDDSKAAGMWSDLDHAFPIALLTRIDNGGVLMWRHSRNSEWWEVVGYIEQ